MDKIANMLISMKNASAVKKPSVSVPHSKFTLAILECLKKANFVGSLNEKTVKGRPFIEVELLYTGTKPKITDVRRVSKLSRRMYTGVKDIKPFKNGSGVAVLSTPKGILTDKEAKAQMVGGEILFTIW